MSDKLVNEREVVVEGVKLFLSGRSGGEEFLPFYAEALKRQMSNPAIAYFPEGDMSRTEIGIYYSEQDKSQDICGHYYQKLVFKSHNNCIYFERNQYHHDARVTIVSDDMHWHRDYNMHKDTQGLFDKFEDEYAIFHDVVRQFVNAYNCADCDGIKHSVELINIYGLDEICLALGRGGKRRYIECSVEELAKMDVTKELSADHWH